jgi:K+-sensing histidine kinase KdpD
MRRIVKNHSAQYVITVVITLIAVLIQYLIIVNAKIAVPGILYPSTFLIAWFFGFGQALLAIFMATLASNFLFFEPRFTLKVMQFDDSVRLAIFAVSSMIASWIVARGREAEVSEQKAKSDLSDLEERFQKSSAATNLGIWYCDLPFDELIWNTEVKEHFWLPHDVRVTIELFYERIHPDDREKTRNAIQKSIDHDVPYDITYRTTNPLNPNEVKYIRAIGWTEFNENKEPLRFNGITLDNTQLHILSMERDESLEVLETLNNVGNILSAELDPEKLVQTVTDAATQLSKAEFGAFFYNVVNEKGESYTLYSVSGVPRDNFTKFPMPRNTEVFAPTFAGKGVIRSDDITKDPRYGKNKPYNGMPEGHLPVVSYLAVPVISRTGEVIGGLFFGHKEKGIFTDREERIVVGLAAQTAIAMDNARLFDKATQAIQLRDEFLSISSHELRTPLTPLKMQIQTLARHIDKGTFTNLTEENIRKMVSVADKQVNRLTSLVDDLLDVSRISSGKMTLNLEDVDLNHLIKEVVERYNPQIQNAKSELTLHLMDSLVTQVDKLRIEQVLINLITNALKYAQGSPLSISLSEMGGNALISVADKGPGISPDDQTRIFGRFERVTSATSQTGLGLGLYIVNQIVSAHGGTIKVDSVTNEGSTFIISIPIKR